MKSILTLSATIAFSLLVSSCHKAPDGESTSTKEASAALAEPQSTSQKQSVTIYTWEDYFSPEVLTDFTQTTGIDVNVESFEDSDGIESDIRSNPGKYDIIVMDGDTVDKLRELQLLHPLNHAALPHFSNLESNHTDLEFDPGNRFSVPYLWGTTLIAYRKDKIASPEKSWKLLWDPALTGRIGMLNERLETLGAALFKNGRSMNARDGESLALAQQDLVNQIQILGARYIEGIPSAITDELSSGNLWATMAYSGDAAMIAQEDPNIGYFIPEEGCALWTDHFVLTRDSQRVDEAHAFLDFMLTGPAAAQNANYLRYATPNGAAISYLDEDLLTNEGIYPPEEVLEKCELAGRRTPERERPVNDLWKTVMMSYSQKATAAHTASSPEDSEDSE